MANIIVSPAVKMAKSEEVKKRFEEIFQDTTKATSFITSMINVVNGNPMLQQCDANSVIGGTLVAAALNLPIDSNLGFAYLVPFNSKEGKKAQLQLGYKAYVQLAMRTAQYKTINASLVYEDELKEYNPITGNIEFTSLCDWKQRYAGDDSKIIGYYADFELHNGFIKKLFMYTKEIKNHAVTYSKSYNSNSATNIWKSDFKSMAMKTVIKLLLKKWGILSVDMQKAITSDQGFVRDINNIEDITYDDALNAIVIDDSVTVLEQELQEGET